MKVRNGFVSNSSSSSFIISTDQEEVKINIEVDLTKFIKATIKTKEELDKYLLEESYCDNIEEWFADWTGNEDKYKSYLRELEVGKVILAFEFYNDSGDALEAYLQEVGLAKSDKYTILKESF